MVSASLATSEKSSQVQTARPKTIMPARVQLPTAFASVAGHNSAANRSSWHNLDWAIQLKSNCLSRPRKLVGTAARISLRNAPIRTGSRTPAKKPRRWPRRWQSRRANKARGQRTPPGNSDLLSRNRSGNSRWQRLRPQLSSALCSEHSGRNRPSRGAEYKDIVWRLGAKLVVDSGHGAMQPAQ
jgi:hypothetical protein